MGKSWRLKGVYDTLIVVPKSEAGKGDKHPVPIPSIISNLDRWLADPISRNELLDIYKHTGGSTVISTNRMSYKDLCRYIKPRLENAFKRGDLVALIDAVKRLFIPESESSVTSSPSKDASGVTRTSSEKRSSWIIFELVDEENNPVKGEKYKIILPDGTVKEDVLDSKGRARFENINSGKCKISFPDLHTDSWEHV